MNERKYLVFKADEFRAWWNNEAHTEKALEELALEDAVVVRLQDRFAAPVLFSYASTARTAAEIMAEAKVDEHIVSGINEIADYFAEMGMRAAEQPGKLPD